jgi:hypothetical protein
MDDETKKIVAWIVQVLIILGIVIGVYFAIKNTPLGKTLDSLAGSLAGVATAIEKMIDSCNKHGWASPKYCPAGFAGILITSVIGCGFLYRFGNYIRSRFGDPQGSTAESAKELGATIGKNPSDIQIDYLRKIDVEKFIEARDAKIKQYLNEKNEDGTAKYTQDEAFERAQKWVDVSADLQVNEGMYKQRAQALESQGATTAEIEQNNKLSQITTDGITKMAQEGENGLNTDDVNSAQEQDFMDDVGE